MIDCCAVTNFNRTAEELEEFLIFSVCVAGKNAEQTARAVNCLLGDSPPLKTIRKWIDSKELVLRLKAAGIGQFTRISRCFEEIVSRKFDLSRVSIEELESVYGIGPKTARFFCLHSRPGVRCAVLDTHILHYLRDLGYPAPTSTPSGKDYQRWEEVYLKVVPDGMDLAEFDLQIWRVYSAPKRPPEPVKVPLQNLKEGFKRYQRIVSFHRDDPRNR